MANGKGTPDCVECKYCLLYGENTLDKTLHGMCSLWNIILPISKSFFDNIQYNNQVLLPVEEFRNFNPICIDFVPIERHGIRCCDLSLKVKRTLRKGLLYAVPYNAVNDPACYYTVVCVLDKKLNTPILKEDWIGEDVETTTKEPMIVSIVPMLQAMWIRLDKDEIIPIKRDNTYKEAFVIKIEKFWNYLGNHFGGIARVIDNNSIYDRYWVLYSITKAEIHKFDNNSIFKITICPQPPVLWMDFWPLFNAGSPILQGMGEIKHFG
jgi:hypothetical protein